MKEDFEKRTKVCCRCKKELPIKMFSKDRSRNDGLNVYCKKCYSMKAKEYKRNYCVFNRNGRKRGNAGTLKRDYELTKEQLEIRERRRRLKGNKRSKRHGILIWYSGELEDLSVSEYSKAISKEYNRQRTCAVRGYIANVQPSEHFLFDFDLEQMLKDNVYISMGGDRKQYITKWWKGEIRHWTVKDGIWKE